MKHPERADRRCRRSELLPIDLRLVHGARAHRHGSRVPIGPRLRSERLNLEIAQQGEILVLFRTSLLLLLPLGILAASVRVIL